MGLLLNSQSGISVGFLGSGFVLMAAATTAGGGDSGSRWHPEHCGDRRVTLGGIQSSVGTVPGTFRALTHSGSQDLLPHPPSRCQAVIPGVSQFLSPQVKGLRAQ